MRFEGSTVVRGANMKRLSMAVLLTWLISIAQPAPLLPDAQDQIPAKAPAANSEIVVPGGTTVSLVLTNPVRANSAGVGSSIYAETAFPVAVNNRIAIPPGTYVQGQVDAETRPGVFSPHAQLQMHFTRLIFTTGYTVEFPNTRSLNAGVPASSPSGAAPGAQPPLEDDVIPAVASAYVLVSSRSDLLLDNGSQLEMVLQVPLRLNSSQVAAAARRSNPVPFGQFRSATQCRPILGSPGTPDTVIPGTPGTPGTPPTVIPGAPGTPDIVIPGTPGTPGTPDTVLPGTPGSPYIACPAPPVVTSDSKMQNYKESFQVDGPVRVYGKPLPAGTYQVTWKGLAPSAQVEIHQNNTLVESVRARVVLLNRKSSANQPATHTDADGALSLRSLRFAGQTFALYFDQDAQ